MTQRETQLDSEDGILLSQGITVGAIRTTFKKCKLN
jgi:hypothetical protein